MNMKTVFVFLFAPLCVTNLYGAEAVEFLAETNTPSYASTVTVNDPQDSGYFFLANTSGEMVYASHPDSASHPRRKLAMRAHALCKYLGFGAARTAIVTFATPNNISDFYADLINLDETGFGYTERFYTINDILNEITHSPTKFSVLNCFNE